jgi:pyrimidine deaminase RibD-like protein
MSVGDSVVIRNEALECFILGFGLEVPDEGRGRPIGLNALWLAVKEKCGDCKVDEVLDALYNLNPGHAELHKFVPLEGKYQALSFERWRPNAKWKDFFYGDPFRIKVLPPGRVRYQKLCAEMEEDDVDRKFARMAIDEARKSVPENDSKPHPLVGAVVVKDGKFLSAAHRGEVPGNHAEFIALDKKLSDETVANATVYTTLEPCTTRNPPKIPCAERIIDRKVARVVIGMLDPDTRIRGLGIQRLRDANISVALFPDDLMSEVEDLNREFSRHRRQQVPQKAAPQLDVEVREVCFDDVLDSVNEDWADFSVERYIFVRVWVVNLESVATVVKEWKLTYTTNKKVIVGCEVTDFSKWRQHVKWKERSGAAPVMHVIKEARNALIPFPSQALQQGIPSEGWVCFKATGVTGTGGDESTIELCLVDSFGWKTLVESPAPLTCKGTMTNPDLPW